MHRVPNSPQTFKLALNVHLHLQRLVYVEELNSSNSKSAVENAKVAAYFFNFFKLMIEISIAKLCSLNNPLRALLLFCNESQLILR